MALYCPKCAKRKWPWQAGAYTKYLYKCREANIFDLATLVEPEWVGDGEAYKAACRAASDELRVIHAKCILSDEEARAARLRRLYGRPPCAHARAAQEAEE